MSAEAESPAAHSSTATIAGVILAAGESSRMGADKALLKYHGKTFLENIISVLQASGIARIVVVLGHHAESIERGVGLAGVEVAINPDYRQGQTSSLQAGLRRLASEKPDGIVLCLVDHPAISADTIRSLIHHFNYKRMPVVVPQTGGKHGHPVLVGRELFDQLLGLGAGEGADTVIHRYRDRTGYVEVADPGITLDIDDQASYQQLLERR